MVSTWWSAERLNGLERLSNDTIAISDAKIARLADDWIARFGSAPSARERQALIDDAINDEILYREAVRLRMHLVDPVVTRRLTQNMRFLTNAEGVEGLHEEVLLRQALDLGMASTDLVVRRRLIQQMRSLLEAMAAPPSLEEGREYVGQHPEEFSTSPRFTISYRFERGVASVEPAGAAPVRSGPTDERGEHAAPLHTGLFSAKRLALTFGQAGADRIGSIGIGEWTGPLQRADGVYWVRLDETIPARPIEFEYVRERALHTLLRERSQQALGHALENLRRLYRIRVAGEAIDLAAAS